MRLRKAVSDDVELLIKLRLDYLTEDKGDISIDEKEKIVNQLRCYFPKHISDNSFICIIAENNDEVMGAVFLTVSEKPANLSFITGKTGTLMNVFTYPRYRRQGIAQKIINVIIDEAKSMNISHINLSATKQGKPLYEKLGFSKSNYTVMGLKLI